MALIFDELITRGFHSISLIRANSPSAKFILMNKYLRNITINASSFSRRRPSVPPHLAPFAFLLPSFSRLIPISVFILILPLSLSLSHTLLVSSKQFFQLNTYLHVAAELFSMLIKYNNFEDPAEVEAVVCSHSHWYIFGLGNSTFTLPSFRKAIVRYCSVSPGIRFPI